MASELCRAMAYEAVHRGARANVHELWAALDAVDEVRPRLIVDIGSERAVQWAWWALGAQVISVLWAVERMTPAFSRGRLPESVIEMVADPRERDIVLRVTDQVARRPVDVLVLGTVGTEGAARILFHAYAPLVRPGGLVLLRGVADPHTPGVGKFWRGLDRQGRKQVVDGTDPIGIGILEIHGKGVATHGR